MLLNYASLLFSSWSLAYIGLSTVAALAITFYFKADLFSFAKNKLAGLTMLGKLLNVANVVGNQIKSIIVNSVSIDTFLTVSEFLPIGSLLEHEKPDFDGANSVLDAMRARDENKVKRILKVASEKAIDKYLREKNVIEIGILDYATFYCDKDVRFLNILLDAIKPEKRLAVFQSTYNLGNRYVFNLALNGSVEVINIVITSLPLQDRFTFINELDNDGNTPTMRRGGSAKVSELKAFLDHCPHEHVFEYLTKKNSKGKTALMELFNVTSPIDAQFNYLFNLIPDDRKKEFLASHQQGEKVMLLAQASKRKRIISILKRYGIAEPAQSNVDEENGEENSNELYLKLIQEWEAKENFKQKFGGYPYAVLGLEQDTSDPVAIKKAYYVGMLKYHPDRNQSVDATVKSQQVISAYEFYTKPETRKNYLKL